LLDDNLHVPVPSIFNFAVLDVLKGAIYLYFRRFGAFYAAQIINFAQRKLMYKSKKELQYGSIYHHLTLKYICLST
jgi:hypothetical protein